MRNKNNLIKNLWLVAISLILTISCTVEEEPDKDPTEDPANGDYRFDNISSKDLTGTELPPKYSPRGIGGGGAMSGFSQSPYSSLWFVGTDMGTLFRSLDWGNSWQAVFHSETIFNSDLTHSPGVGFFGDSQTVLHAPGGKNVSRSLDHGKTWDKVTFPLGSGEYVKSWYGNSYSDSTLFALTTEALWKTIDKGTTWKKVLAKRPMGVHLDYLAPGKDKPYSFITYTAAEDGVYKSNDEGATWTKIYTPSGFKIRKFTGGRDKFGLTLAFADNQGMFACSEVESYRSGWGKAAIDNHYANCGYLWVSKQSTSDTAITFTKSNQQVGDHLKMAENDSSTIVVTGSREWIRQYGTKVWLSENGGDSFTKVFHQMNWDVTPFEPWPESKMDYSAVALDIGWYDNGYVSFNMNQRNSSEFGGTGYFFLHVSRNKGSYWDAPFTNYEGTETPSEKKNWSSTGLEVTTVYRLKFHPENPNLGYAAMADVSGMVTEDGGKSFRLTTTGQNSIYDYAFDKDNDQIVYAVSGGEHDYPINWHANVTKSIGGVFKSTDRAKTWTRITPNNDQFNRQFLSLGYDKPSNTLYAGTQSLGVARSTNGGTTWAYFNAGLPSGNLIIPQIEVDPQNGDVYALVTGNAPDFTNYTKTGIYKLARGGSSWQHLRGTVHKPSGVNDNHWYYPTGFAIDLSDTGDRSILYLIDYENNRNWLATGVWKSEDGGQNWYRKQQYTHPLGIRIDSNDPQRVYVSGLFQLDGNWGQGGSLYSNDGGETWQEDADVPYKINGRTVTIDPNDPQKIFYTFFGSGLLFGTRPD